MRLDTYVRGFVVGSGVRWKGFNRQQETNNNTLLLGRPAQDATVEEFLAMPEVNDCTVPGLKKLLDDVMDRAGIPKENIIGFAADNASVMSGIHAGLATLLRIDGRPWLAHFGCICHSFALCASAACSVLSPNIIKFATISITSFAAVLSEKLNLKIPSGLLMQKTEKSFIRLKHAG